MYKKYYQENKNFILDHNKKEKLAFWSDEDTYNWIEKEQPNSQLIEAIVLKYHGISSTSIAFIYNQKNFCDNPINEFIIEHVINTCNKYKCTFGVFGEYEKINSLWYYKVDNNTELNIRKNNPYINEKKQKTKEYIINLENKIKALENELIHINAEGVSQRRNPSVV